MAAITGSRPPLADQFNQLLSARKSCRAFLPEPVSDQVIDEILGMAQKTASWNNVQPWKLIITRGRGTQRFRETIYERALDSGPATSHFSFPREYTGVYQERRRACGFQLYEAVGVQRGDKAGYARQTMRNFCFFDAPHVAVVTTEEALGVYGAVDCGAYVSNFMLAASSMGVATIAQGALANFSELIATYFDLVPSRKVVCGISFGFPDRAHPSNHFSVPRAPIDEVATFIDE